VDTEAEGEDGCEGSFGGSICIRFGMVFVAPDNGRAIMDRSSYSGRLWCDTFVRCSFINLPDTGVTVGWIPIDTVSSSPLPLQFHLFLRAQGISRCIKAQYLFKTHINRQNPG
jgi:hypothetical protein